MTDTAVDRVVLSREALYERVWATPMRHLAKEYGLSDVGLAKICKKLNVPRPGVGYWAKKQHGKSVRRKRLPGCADPGIQSVTLYVREYEPWLDPVHGPPGDSKTDNRGNRTLTSH